MTGRGRLAALAVVYLAVHLASLPPTLEDIDSVNFALGVRDFDVARHQPHPPGYPVFIALGKLATAAFGVVGVPAPEPRALAALSALAGAALVPLLFVLYGALIGNSPVAWWAMAVAVCSPLLWFTALRPLSDTTGLACAVAAQALALAALGQAQRGEAGARAGRLLVAAGLLSGLAGGVRVQTALLTLPLLLTVLVWPGAFSWRHRLQALGAVLAGGIVWAIPLLAASGGLAGYATALGSQAGEDFSGVVMLWTTRDGRVAANALLYTFVWPWGAFAAGLLMCVAAGLGLVRLAWHAPAAAALVAVAFGPYAVFHLLFHETATVRYALPLIVPVALLGAYAAATAGRAALRGAAAASVIVSLVLTVPAMRAYGRDGSPAFRNFEANAAGGAPATAIAMHAVMRRVGEWYESTGAARPIVAPHGREWLALVEHWRSNPDVPVQFFADPRRTDLALFDPQAVTLGASERWTFPEMPFVAGTRPGAADWYRMTPPGWMLDRGWALTAEVGGVTARERLGPHVAPSIAWVRSRRGGASMIVGGRNLAGTGGPGARLTVAAADRVIDAWEAAPGPFFRHVLVPADVLNGSGYVPLQFRSVPAAGADGPAPVSLEQFDLQSDGTVILGLVDGWHEPEYNPATAVQWRWMSERSRVWIRPIGRDLKLVISGESPLRYFERAPSVRITVGGVEVSRFSPAADFVREVTIPAERLAASGGLVAIESELWFTPAERQQSADRRHLALRIYAVRVR